MGDRRGGGTQRTTGARQKRWTALPTRVTPTTTQRRMSTTTTTSWCARGDFFRGGFQSCTRSGFPGVFFFLLLFLFFLRFWYMQKKEQEHYTYQVEHNFIEYIYRCMRYTLVLLRALCVLLAAFISCVGVCGCVFFVFYFLLCLMCSCCVVTLSGDHNISLPPGFPGFSFSTVTHMCDAVERYIRWALDPLNGRFVG